MFVICNDLRTAFPFCVGTDNQRPHSDGISDFRVDAMSAPHGGGKVKTALTRFLFQCNGPLSLRSIVVYCQLRTRRALTLFNHVLLRTRRALSPYEVYSNSPLLVFNGTSLNSDNTLLALN